MSITHTQFEYNCPRGQEVDVLTFLIYQREDLRRLMFTRQQMHETRDMVRHVVKQTFSDRFIENHLNTSGMTIVYVGHDVEGKAALMVHDCGVNIGYKFSDTEFLKRGLVAKLFWCYGKMTIESMWPSSLFDQCTIMTHAEYYQKYPEFAAFSNIAQIPHDNESRPLTQPSSGIIRSQSFTVYMEHSEPWDHPRYFFFLTLNSTDLLVAAGLSEWKAYLLNAICTDMMATSEPILLREVMKSVRSK